MHQHGPGCQHGHGHGNGPSQAHGRGAPAGNPFSMQMSYEQYRQTLQKMWEGNRQFYWTEVLTGNLGDRFLMNYNLVILRIVNCMPVLMLLGWLENYLSFECLPNEMRAVISGAFFPLAVILLFNYSVVNYGVDAVSADATDTVPDDPNKLFRYMIYATLGMYIICVFRGPGSLSTRECQELSKEGIKQRPYLQNPQMNCLQCGILKTFRSSHCPRCKQCIPKYTRHSMFFNLCVGASNQFPIMLFFLMLSFTAGVSIWEYFHCQSNGFLTGFLYLFINWFICWSSFTEFCTFLIINTYYGVTENQLKNWMVQQYMVKFPIRQYQNNVNNGFAHNLKEQIYAFLGIEGIEKTMILKANLADNIENPVQQMEHKKLDSNQLYIVNWNNAFFYILPHMPNHSARNDVIEMMGRQQPKMINAYRMSQKFKKQVIAESKQPMSEAEVGQKVGMKMREYMMKNNPQGFGPRGPGMPGMSGHGQHGQAPSAEQQKMIQLQILDHLTKDPACQPDKAAIDRLVGQLKADKISPDEVNIQLRQLQQSIMGRKMQEMMKQRSQASEQNVAPQPIPIRENITPNSDIANKGDDQQEMLKVQEEIEPEN